MVRTIYKAQKMRISLSQMVGMSSTLGVTMIELLVYQEFTYLYMKNFDER